MIKEINLDMEYDVDYTDTDNEFSIVSSFACSDYKEKLQYEIDKHKELYNEDLETYKKMLDELDKEDLLCCVFSRVFHKLKEYSYEDLHDSLEYCEVSVQIKTNK